MEFKILGQLEVVRAGDRVDLGGPKQRAVLGLLLMEANRVVSVDRLVDQLWAGQPPARAIGTLQAYVSNLRRVLEPGRAAGAPAAVLVTRPPGYVLRADPDQVDALRFERLVAEGRRALATADHERGAGLLAHALALWRGPALADFSFEPFATAEAARLEELRLSALEDWLEAALALGRHSAVVADLEQLVAAHPLRERLRGQLLLALYRCDRQAEALRCYEAGRRLLADELGIEPSPALQALDAAILSHDPALAPARPAGPAWPVASPEPVAAVADPATGPATSALAGAGLVGREAELAELEAALAEALARRPRVVLLAGEPGIGKTRLAEEVARRAAGRGAEVVWGRCYDTEGAPAFWPWIQVIRHLTTRGDPATMAAALGPGVADIAQIVPEVKDLVVSLEPPPVLDPDAARFRLYDGVSRFLVRLAAGRPLALVLDDLHWADLASLQLLSFLTRQLVEVPVVVVGTFREAEVLPDHPLTATLAELAREPTVGRLSIGGLSERDVARYLTEATGQAPGEDLVADVHARTEGNPFFLAELVRLLQSEGRLGRTGAGAEEAAAVGRLRHGVPVGVRDVIVRRLARLPEAARSLLTTAAVVGRGFDLEVLEQVDHLDGDRALELVEAALLTGIVVEDPDSIGRYRFAHTLVRETLYDQLTAIRRARLHGRVGAALEHLHGDAHRLHVAELAHHFLLAARGGGDADKAVHYAVRAAEAATAGLAYEEAVARYEGALEAADRSRAQQPDRRVELLLALGDARWRAGEVARARETFLEAAEAADRLGRTDLLARAVLGFGGGLYRDWHATRGAHAGRLVPLLEQAIAGVGAEDSPLRARLLGHLAEELCWSGLDERRASLSQEAVAMARRLGDPAALAAALCSRCLVAWNPDLVEERHQIAAEIVRMAEQLGSRELSLFGHHYLFVAQLELGDPAADATLDAFEDLAEDLRQPLYLWEARWLRGLQALLVGRYDDAERLAFEALEMGQRAEDPDALAVFGVQIGSLRLEQGRVGEMLPAVQAFVEQFPETPSWRAALCIVLIAVGDEEAARAEFDRLAADRFAVLPRNFAWLAGLALLTEVAAHFADAERAAVLYDLLRPYAERTILTSDRQCFGSAAHHLGVLATTLGRYEEAARWFDQAGQVHERLGARPWLAHTAHRRARMLLARGGAGDQERAGALLDAAAALAGEIGMARLAALVAADRAALGGGGAERDRAGAPSAAGGRQVVDQGKG